MSDITKRVGKKRTTYRVRYPCPSTKSGYASKTFDTQKEARHFIESGAAKANRLSLNTAITTMSQAADKWLQICEKEGRKGKDPVTPYTLEEYARRARVIRSYPWIEPIQELRTSDIVAFKSWLIETCVSRYRAGRVLSSIYGILEEMSLRDVVETNVATGVSVGSNSRYTEPVTIPSSEEITALLDAADRLANSPHTQIAQAWQRYRPMLYLAVDSGMRPQEYVAVAKANFFNGGVQVERAIERPGTRISVPKTPAGRRFIDLSPAVYKMVKNYIRDHSIENSYDLAFPNTMGRWQNIDHWRRNGFDVASREAGLFDETDDGGGIEFEKRYTPYHLRHYYASLLFDTDMNDQVNLKKIQMSMGHKDIKTTMDTYGHLMIYSKSAASEKRGALARMNRS